MLQLGCFAMFFVVFMPTIVIFLGDIEPFYRGFYCNDDSIKYPYRNNTIPSWVVFVVGVFVTVGFVSNLCLLYLINFVILPYYVNVVFQSAWRVSSDYWSLIVMLGKSAEVIF